MVNSCKCFKGTTCFFLNYNVAHVVVQGMKNFTPTAANLLATIAKVDCNYYPEVLNSLKNTLFVLEALLQV